jgi:hypothetical protein
VARPASTSPISSEQIAQDVLTRGALPVSSAAAHDFLAWTPVAADVDPATGVGAVALVRRSGAGWYAMIEICRRSPEGEWRPAEGNGDHWPSDPAVRPDGPGIVGATGVSGYRLDDGVWAVSLAGVVGRGVSELRLVEPGVRRLMLNAANGAFVVTATRAGGDDPPGLELAAHSAASEPATLRWDPPVGLRG